MITHTAPRTILFAGFTGDTRTIAQDFSRRGCDTVFAPGVDDVLQHALKLQPDLVLLDADMPQMTAFETCRRLKAEDATRDIPVLFMITAQDEGARAAVFDAGGADYVAKPLQAGEVLARAGTLLRLRELERRLMPQEGQVPQLPEGTGADTFHESEQRYREIFDNVSDFLYLLEVTADKRFRFAEVNLGVERLMRLSRAEIIGKYVEDVIPHAEGQGVLNRLRRCLDAGAVIDEAAEIDLPGGRLVFQATYIPIRRHDGGPIYRIASIARDVAMQKQNETMRLQRAELESLVRKIIELTPGALVTFRCSPDGKWSMPYASPKLEEITGFDRGNMRRDATSGLQAIHPEDLAGHLASIDASARSLLPWTNEFRVHHPSKGERWIEGCAVPERTPDGAITWYGFLHDVTVRKQAEERLHDSERKFRTLADSLPDVIIRYDRECRRIYANRIFEKVTGLTAEQALADLPPPEWPADISRDEYLAILRQAMEKGQASENFMTWRLPDGQVAHFIFHAVPERDREGQVAGVLVLARNIAALKEAEMHLRESREQLRQLAAHRDCVREEERKHIARELHDELGQFLSALRMQASMLRMRFGTGNPALIEHVAEMIKLVDRNIQVVRDISSTLRPTVLDMGIVAALAWQVKKFVKYAGIPCDLDVRDKDIDMDEHCATTLFRVVQESLTNVARHAGASRVSISLRCSQTHYLLKVKDDGKGFDPDRLAKKTLGLLGMRERVATLGGDIRIASKPGKGTLLEVKIPAARGEGKFPAERAS